MSHRHNFNETLRKQMPSSTLLAKTNDTTIHSFPSVHVALVATSGKAACAVFSIIMASPFYTASSSHSPASGAYRAWLNEAACEENSTSGILAGDNSHYIVDPTMHGERTGQISFHRIHSQRAQRAGRRKAWIRSISREDNITTMAFVASL